MDGDLNATVVNSSSIFLSWLPPKLLARNGLVQKYKVHYTRFEVAGERVSDQENAIELSMGKTKIEQNRRLSVTLSALHPASRYAIRVSGCTLGGCRQGNKREVLSEATLEEGKSWYQIEDLA